MVHKYKVTGMTCSSCEEKVKSALSKIDQVRAVEVSKEDQTAIITMDRHISLFDFQKVLDNKYQISDIYHKETSEPTQSWFSTYKPILLIFSYITAITLVVQTGNDRFDFMQWMRHFMAAFFLIFSFFKMLNLKGFSDSYVMYDVIAKTIPAWAYVYAFLELGLGFAYLTNFNPIVTNSVTAIVMSLSMIGVLQTVMNKKKIQCACLGAVFNLPMSTVTIIENGLMIIMSVAMLFHLSR